MDNITIRTPRDAFNELAVRLEREPERTQGIIAVYQFDITGEQGGKWYVNIEDGTAKVIEGEVPNPGCTIVMKASDYVAMATGKLSGNEAFMSGKLRVRGDIELSMKAAQIFG
jgi:putative sterol carrier protein